MLITDNSEAYIKARNTIQATLERQGYYVESDGANGLSFSLTSIGLSTVYATVTQEEIEYHVENETEL